MTASILFFVFAVLAIAGGLGMLISRNPVNSALWLILNLFCIAGLYLTLNATFIAVVQILVYAGAIMVLFVFVIMLLNLSELPKLRIVDWRRVLAFAVGVGILGQLAYVIAAALDALPQPVTLEQAAEGGSVDVLAKALFTQYAFPLEVIGILLLVATIGAVMLAKRRFV